VSEVFEIFRYSKLLSCSLHQQPATINSELNIIRFIFEIHKLTPRLEWFQSRPTKIMKARAISSVSLYISGQEQRFELRRAKESVSAIVKEKLTKLSCQVRYIQFRRKSTTRVGTIRNSDQACQQTTVVSPSPQTIARRTRVHHD
jgi:hypothetical protein